MLYFTPTSIKPKINQEKKKKKSSFSFNFLANQIETKKMKEITIQIKPKPLSWKPVRAEEKISKHRFEKKETKPKSITTLLNFPSCSWQTKHKSRRRKKNNP